LSGSHSQASGSAGGCDSTIKTLALRARSEFKGSTVELRIRYLFRVITASKRRSIK